MANQETKNEVSDFNLPAEIDSAKDYLFDLMTNDEREIKFGAILTEPRKRTREIKEIASMMKLYPDLFMKIIENKNGSRRMQQLFTVSDEEADGDFCSAILSRLVPIMTHRFFFGVVSKAMEAFAQEPRKRLYDSTAESVVEIARDPVGYTTIIGIIGLGNVEYRFPLCRKIAANAFHLSIDRYGSFVVRNVLTLNDLGLTAGILIKLRGRFVQLSLDKAGSFVVQKLLETEANSVSTIVGEILECNEDQLRTLATHGSGSHVVHKALKVTSEMMPPANLFSHLKSRLTPLRRDLIFYRRNHIVEVLGSRDN